MKRICHLSESGFSRAKLTFRPLLSCHGATRSFCHLLGVGSPQRNIGACQRIRYLPLAIRLGWAWIMLISLKWSLARWIGYGRGRSHTYVDARFDLWSLTYTNSMLVSGWCGCSYRSEARSIDRSIFGHLWTIGHTRCVLLASILVSIINFARKPIARMLARCDPRRTLLRSLGCLVASQRSLGYYLLLLAWVFLLACMLARESILLGPRLEAALPNVQGKKEAI